mmetsp:Transcript_10018/g.27234  ORF Transcript_10018/g.27234 Transcript_10018/m.27234 type:complete len:117 (+) Transcript_10018:1190-1540(+)
MSKKNNLKLRAQSHAYALRKEKEQREKLAKKAERKKENAEALDVLSKLGLSQTNKKTSKKLGISTTTKTKRKGVRLRKNAVVRGIKVKDAESKRQIREILEGEADGMDGLENADSD